MATMNVSLPKKMKEYIETQVKEGFYSNTSDYVRELIRRDQEFTEKIKLINKALNEGEESGISDKTLEDIWKDVTEDV